MKNLTKILLASVLFFSCAGQKTIQRHGLRYQENGSYQHLQKVVKLIPLGTDTADVRRILGEPIDMGFDYRYLVDSIGPSGCTIGAVFHIDEFGKIDQKWLDEICE